MYRSWLVHIALISVLPNAWPCTSHDYFRIRRRQTILKRFLRLVFGYNGAQALEKNKYLANGRMSMDSLQI